MIHSSPVATVATSRMHPSTASGSPLNGLLSQFRSSRSVCSPVDFMERLSEFLELLCPTASAGCGRAQHQSEFLERASVFLACLCPTASAGYGRAQRLPEFLE